MQLLDNCGLECKLNLQLCILVVVYDCYFDVFLEVSG